MFVIKYAGIIVLSDLDRYSLFPLLVQRLSIYTNPQMPLSIEEKLYEIGTPGEDSPVLLTSNWALTYLILSSAIEDTGIPAYLCVKSIEEADVLCWCHHCLRSTQPGTLNINDTSQLIEECGIGKRVTHRKLVIPGRASRFKAELVRALPEWEIVTGPDEEIRFHGENGFQCRIPEMFVRSLVCHFGSLGTAVVKKAVVHSSDDHETHLVGGC